MAKHGAETASEKSLAQADCSTYASHELIGNFVGAFSAAGEDIVDV